MRQLIATCVIAAAPLACGAATDLMHVFALALQHDAEYRAAGSTNAAAQEIRPQARSALLPTVGASASLNADYLQNRQTGSLTQGDFAFDRNDFAISLNQPLYRHDLWVALEQAGSLIRAANLTYAFARQDLMLRVAERYFGVLAAADQLEFAQATLNSFEQQLKQAQQRFDVGIIAITDVEEAQAGFDQAKSDIIIAENATDNAAEALREITGSYHQELALLAADVPLIVPEPEDIDQWTETALRQNLQLAAAMSGADTAWKEIERVRSGHLPTLDLVGRHVRNRADNGPTGPTRTWNTSIGLEVNLPIYQGGFVLSRTRESRALYRQSLDEVERQRRSTQRQTRDSYFGVVSEISRVRALEQAVRSSESQVKAITAAFQVGTRTSVDVLNAESDLFESRRALAGSKYAYILNILALKLSAGTLAESDLEQINGWLR